MGIENVQCTFESKEECYEMAPKVFEDCFQVEFIVDDSSASEVVNNHQIKVKRDNLKQIFDFLLENEQVVTADYADNDIDYQKISSNGRVGFCLHINKHVVDFVLTIFYIISQERSLDSILVTTGGMLLKIFLDSVHFNKGFERCVALEIDQILSKENHTLFSLEDLESVYRNRIDRGQKCPHNIICNFKAKTESESEAETDTCLIRNDISLIIQDVLDKMEKCGVIVHRCGKYEVCPVISLE